MFKKMFSEARQSSKNDTWEDQYDKVVAYLNKVKVEMSDLMKSCGQLEYELEEERKNGEAQTKKWLLELIEVLDSFEGLFKHIEPDLPDASPQVKNWTESFRTVYLLLQQAMDNQNVISLETEVGENVNPHRYKIVKVIAKPGWQNHTVAEVLRKGYIWNGKILRYAEVIAVKNES